MLQQNSGMLQPEQLPLVNVTLCDIWRSKRCGGDGSQRGCEGDELGQHTGHCFQRAGDAVDVPGGCLPQLAGLHLTHAGFTLGQLGLCLENNLVEIFLLMCDTSAQASSGLGERRQQAGLWPSWAMLLAEWRGSCITARLHLNLPESWASPTNSLRPTYNLTPAQRDSLRPAERE